MKVLPSKDQIIPIMIISLLTIAIASRVPMVGNLVYPKAA
jgi:hypothetical protein